MEEQLRILIISDARKRSEWNPFFLACLDDLCPRLDLLFADEPKRFSKGIDAAPDLILSDLRASALPITFIKDTLRKRDLAVPILVALPVDEEPRAIRAITDGADDYVFETNKDRFALSAKNLLKRATIERDRKEAAEQLTASEEGFRQLIEHVLDIITVTDINAKILYESPSLERVLGYKPEELIGKNAFSLIHPLDIATTMPVFMLAVATPGVPHAARFRFRHKDGSWRQLEAVGKTIRDPGQGIRLIVTSRDVSDKTQAEAALSQSHTRFRAVVEGLSEGLVLTDASGNIAYFNSRMSEMTGYAPQEMIGEPLFGKILARDDIPSWPPQKREQIETRLRRKNGSSFWTEILSTPYRDDDRMLGTISAFVDITERKEFELQLDKERREAIIAKDHAEEMNRMKTNFLANLSHEIRTPLTSIIGFASLLKESLEEMKASELIEFASTIHSGGERLLRTMSGLLDLASFESHPKEFRSEVAELNLMLPAIAEQLRDEAERKLLRFDIMVPQRPKILAEIDATYLSDILRHVIGNAIKFTHNGQVLITLAQQLGRAVIEISDTGIGITQDFLPQIFEPFQQESDGLNRNYEGNGLGLTLAKLMTERMNGSIEASSIKGTGTTITLRFPVAVVTRVAELRQ